ncbi:hypothetical protein MNB_SUP05-5-745 [hydrothermal vent metagenome]|uniref:Isoprenylcysteine carboxylmethyltransferase family protein n=1 Tax=hydrothermal vent metagenome TaxID=652676 RepID=A0A1W1BVY3_9ZZZZ
MEINNLNILPVLKKNHQLRTNDIYCLVRHPMYGSLLLLCFSLMLNNVNIFSLFVFMGLAINLFLKATYEEGKLLAKFSEYEDYQKKTSMFFPLKFFFKK